LVPLVRQGQIPQMVESAEQPVQQVADLHCRLSVVEVAHLAM
tara:strand:+ start:249 stop:374 length:126 start_codon:yes stop_codon:yes gene_type:complete